jgi:hypothetical protein
VSEEVTLIASEVQRVVTAQPRNSVLTLSDLTGGEFRRAITRMKEVAVFDRPYVKRAAIVGCRESIQRLLRGVEDLLPTRIPQVQHTGGSNELAGTGGDVITSVPALRFDHKFFGG